MKLSASHIAPRNWQRQALKDVCEKITSGGTPSRRNADYFKNGEFHWVKTKELADTTIYSTEEKITLTAIENSSAKTLPADTILMAMYGATIGKLARLASPMTCNQACAALIVGDKADADFIFYQLLAHRDEIIGMGTGAAQQNLNGNVVKNIILPFPSLSEQKAIGSILRALDDKIEANRRMNETLEAMAQALFQDWFVDFGPTKAKMRGEKPYLAPDIWKLFPDRLGDNGLPIGWKKDVLGSHVQCFDGKRIPLSKSERDKRPGSFPYYGAAGQIDTLDNYIFEGTFTLLAEDGSVEREDGRAFTQLVSGKFWVNNHAHVLTGRTSVSTEFIYLFLSQAHISPFVTGAVQKKINQGNMNRIPISIASEAVLQKFNEVISISFEQILKNRAESQTLAELRDTLLPRLMSGELSVAAASGVKQC